VQATAKTKPPAAGKGRPKGAQNKTTKALKEMILGALKDSGGQAYLTRCAQDPKLAPAFLALLGKVLPAEMRLGDPEGKPLQAVAPVFHVTLSPSEIPKEK
jgi:hypothetical protein